MADMGKHEEGNAHAEKRKFDQPNTDDETFEEEVGANDGESEFRKRQKLETASENETEPIHSFVIGGKMAETDGGGENSKIVEGNDKDEHLNVESEIVQTRRRFTAEEKGKAIMVEESDEESYEDDSSSESSDSDFSDGLDSESEDIPF